MESGQPLPNKMKECCVSTKSCISKYRCYGSKIVILARAPFSGNSKTNQSNRNRERDSIERININFLSVN